MRIPSEHIVTLLAYAKDKHGAPCRVEFSAGWGCTVVEIYLRDFQPLLPMALERIVI